LVGENGGGFDFDWGAFTGGERDSEPAERESDVALVHWNLRIAGRKQRRSGT
jgi:hypothetical protein